MKNARRMPQFNVRMSKQLRDWIERKAEENHRSMNSEINFILEKYRKECETGNNNEVRR